MTDTRTPRTLLIADPLWRALEQMASEMGTDRDGLVNQALFAFARRNGYIVPGALKPLEPAPGTLQEGPAHPEPRGARRSRRSQIAAVPPAPELQPADAPREPAKGPLLVLLADGREVDRIVKSRFVIGRGKHCDLVINSGKVSREHAAISREGALYFIEDLGSSNGTWFDQRRITRRQIHDGDEYFISAERLTCVFR